MSGSQELSAVPLPRDGSLQDTVTWPLDVPLPHTDISEYARTAPIDPLADRPLQFAIISK